MSSTLIALGPIDQAEPLLERFERVARGLNRPSALALAARCHGLIAADRNDQAAATDAFERALAEHELSAALATLDALAASRWADRARGRARVAGRPGPGAVRQELVDQHPRG